MVKHEMLIHDDSAGVPEWRIVAQLHTRDPEQAARAAALTAQHIIALHPGVDAPTGASGIPVSTRVTVTWKAE